MDAHAAAGAMIGVLLVLATATDGAPAAAARACADPREVRHLESYGLAVCDAAPGASGSRDVVVAAVEGMAAREGLVAGDRIYQVNREPVASAADLARAVERAEGTLVLVNFRRGSAPYLVRLPRAR